MTMLQDPPNTRGKVAPERLAYSFAKLAEGYNKSHCPSPGLLQAISHLKRAR